MLASGIPLFVFGVDGWLAWLLLWPIFLFSFLVLYMLGGHAPIYGPHLFIYGFIDLARAPFRRSPTVSSPGPPCPECGERLATPMARQCFHCGADWHQKTMDNEDQAEGTY
jgi:hypothetical protein